MSKRRKLSLYDRHHNAVSGESLHSECEEVSSQLTKSVQSTSASVIREMGEPQQTPPMKESDDELFNAILKASPESMKAVASRIQNTSELPAFERIKRGLHEMSR